MDRDDVKTRKAPISRRKVIGAGLATVAVAGGVGGGLIAFGPHRSVAVRPTGAAVQDAERIRSSTGNIVRKTLISRPSHIDLGGRVVDTSTYGGAIHGPLIRVTAGDELRVSLQNGLATGTTVHWHGLALRNDMDGVPGLTMKPVVSQGEFEYAFKVPEPGTYWYHPHVGTQIDTGLYGPLIVDDPHDPGTYDVEAVLMLDDWTDGWGTRPASILDDMRKNGMSGGGMGSMGTMTSDPAEPLGPDTGDVSYPGHLINGRLPSDPVTVSARPGQRVKLRVINAGGDTAYRFAISGHRLTVTHADGFPVDPVQTDALIIGMGERYDVEVTAKDGAFLIASVPEGKGDPAASAVLRTSSGEIPTGIRAVRELSGRLLTYRDLHPTAASRLPLRKIDRHLDLSMTMGRGGRQWLLNGRTFADHEPLNVNEGERVRLRMTNMTGMFHPMHLHGHTFALTGNGTRKDTVNVLPMRSQSIDVHADNPGQWALHCHNVYHGELGMMTIVSYVT